MFSRDIIRVVRIDMRRRRVLIFGAGGMLGQEFIAQLATERGLHVILSNHAKSDITDFTSVRRVLKRSHPDIVINCAANIVVDICEAKPIEAWAVNALGPGNIVRALAELGFHRTLFLQISTADVFGSTAIKMHTVRDVPHPVNVYGWSKWGGEVISAAEAAAGDVPFIIVRTSWLYSFRRATFVDAVARSLLEGRPIVAATDQYNLPVSVGDVARRVRTLIRHPIHAANRTIHLAPRVVHPVSRYDIARFIATVLGKDSALVRRGFRKDIFKAPRPCHSTLVPSQGIELPHWKHALAKYMRARYGRLAGGRPKI